MSCEDFPCCGHEMGCCPDFDAAGNQLNMKCVCGATVPLGSRSSLCRGCLRANDDFDDGFENDSDEDEDSVGGSDQEPDDSFYAELDGDQGEAYEFDDSY